MKSIIRTKGTNIQGRRKRIKILEASGEAFAAHGYAATSVRDIAHVADVQPSALIYHFKSKEALFQETLRYHIIDNDKFVEMFGPFKNIDTTNHQAISNAAFATIEKIMHACHGPAGRIKNFKGLLVALITEGGMEANRKVREMVNEAMSDAFNKVRSVNPKLDESEMFWWTHLIWGLVLYSVFGENFILAETGSNKYSREFIQMLSWRIAKVSCKSFGLPLPEVSMPIDIPMQH